MKWVVLTVFGLAAVSGCGETPDSESVDLPLTGSADTVDESGASPAAEPNPETTGEPGAVDAPIEPDEGSGEESADCVDGPPKVQLTYPAPNSASNGRSSVVRGTATAACNTTITAVMAIVGETEIEVPIAPGSDLEWQFELDLGDESSESIEIQARSSVTQSASTTLTLARDLSPLPDLARVRGVTIIPELNTAFLMDREQDAIVSVDLDTGVRAIFSGIGVGDGPVFERMEGGASYDQSRNQLLVTDRGMQAILAVDLASGDRTIISDNSDTGVLIDDPVGIAVDSTSGVAYYSDLRIDGIVKVDLLTGHRTVLSDANVPASPQPIDFGTPLGVVLDATRGRLLVVDARADALIEVDLTDGSRRSIEQSTTSVDLAIPRAIALGQDRAVIADLKERIIEIDLRAGPTLGDRTVLSSNSTAGGPRLFDPYGVAIDAASNRLIVADGAYRLPLVVDRAGERTLFEAQGTPLVGTGPRFTDPSGLAFDTDLSLLYIADRHTGSLFTLDVQTGHRRVIAQSTLEPQGLGFDPVSRTLFVPDRFGKSQLLALDLNDNSFSVVSNQASPGPVPGILYNPRGQVTVEPGGESLLVADPVRCGVYRIDLATGTRTDFIRRGWLCDAQSVIIDEKRSWAIVSAGSRRDDDAFDGIIAYDLATATATELASTSNHHTPNGTGVELTHPCAMALDELNDALIVFDADLDALVSLDLGTLHRSIVVDSSTGGGDYLSRAFNDQNAMAFDPNSRVVYLANERVGEVVMIDLDTGEQTLIAR